MMRFLRGKPARTVVSGLVLAGVLAWSPTVSFGSRNYTNGYETNGYEDRTGDPIDGNDFSSGGSGGGEDNFFRDFSTTLKSEPAVSSRAFVLPVGFGGARIVVIPGFDGGMFRVQFMVVDGKTSPAELDHAE